MMVNINNFSSSRTYPEFPDLGQDGDTRAERFVKAEQKKSEWLGWVPYLKNQSGVERAWTLAKTAYHARNASLPMTHVQTFFEGHLAAKDVFKWAHSVAQKRPRDVSPAMHRLNACAAYATAAVVAGLIGIPTYAMAGAWLGVQAVMTGADFGARYIAAALGVKSEPEPLMLASVEDALALHLRPGLFKAMAEVVSNRI